MRSLAVTFAAVSALGLAGSVAGCSPDDHRGQSHGYAEPPPACSAATTCGACTPLSGCGWCEYEDGTGSCTTSPTRCKKPTFRWNWDPETCPASATDAGDAEASTDAGRAETSTDAASDGLADATSDAAEVATDTSEETAADAESDGAATDGATDTGATDSGATDSGATDTGVTDTGATDTGPKCGVDTVPAGCAVSTGGTLCKATEYTLGCLGAAAPAPSAACIKAYAKGAETYHCCPCR